MSPCPDTLSVSKSYPESLVFMYCRGLEQMKVYWTKNAKISYVTEYPDSFEPHVFCKVKTTSCFWFCFHALILFCWCNYHSTRENSVSISYPGFSGGGGGGSSGNGNGAGSSSGGDGDGDYFGMIFGSGAPPTALCTTTTTILLSLLIILTLCISTNHDALLLLLQLS